MLQLGEDLHARIIGQPDAVAAVAEAIQRSRAGMKDPSGPIASFLFLGPTGVGKTELAKALAANLFNGEDAMARRRRRLQPPAAAAACFPPPPAAAPRLASNFDAQPTSPNPRKRTTHV